MSLADLLDIEVTTASRFPETVTNTPAAVFVITQDDIRRSGATSIPEALRLAPGVQVARINAGTWAIGIRGFADRLARSVLVLIDGRAVYSPLFAGTYWETQDTVLADVDRIEVVRGPGGTLWGANAVNGIVNIITRRAKDTQGLMVSGGAGTEDRAFGSIRYGGTSGATSYRAYVKAFDRGPEFHADGNDYDGWRAGQAGFRIDWTSPANRAVTVQGDLYDGRLGERPTISFYTPPFSTTANLGAPLSGGNVLARFTSPTGSRNEIQVQTYIDHTSRDELPVSEDRTTFDVDFQQTLRSWPRQTAIWGAGYRVTSGAIVALPPTAFTPPTRTDSLYSAFFQDEIVVVPARWRLTAGVKVEHNDYSGFEIQPSMRALWTPAAVSTIWAAVTRAIRTPSRVETDYTTTSLVTAAAALPIFVRLQPDPAFVPEQLWAYEAGYRARLASPAFVTLSAFYNRLSHTLSTDVFTAFVEAVPPPSRIVLPVRFGNTLHGESAGGEITADLRPRPWWRLTGSYSYLNVAMSRNPGSTDVSQESQYENSAPHHLTAVGTSFDLPGKWSVDWLFRHVSALQAGPVPAYNASTIRVGWLLHSQLELSVAGQDLFSAHHLEWPSSAGYVEVERSVYAQLTWRR